MIRKIPPDPIMSTRTTIISRACGYAAALSVALVFVLPATEANGQSGYLTRDPNVRIDMSVLEELGPPLTVAGQHLPSRPITTRPILFPPTTMPVSRLTGPLLNRRLNPAPAPRRQISALPRPTIAPPPTVVVQAPVTAAPMPAPANVEVRAAAPATSKPPTPVPPPPTPPSAPAVATVDPPPAPPSAPAVATVDPAPAPTAAPTEEVQIAAPAPPAATSAPEPPTPAPQQKAPEPPETTAEATSTTPSTPALTPSPIGTPPPAPVQTALRPNAALAKPSYRVLFENKSAKISDSARAPLEELSNAMKERENLRVQLMAYADGTSETASQARRLSLSRALAVRSFLINQGVRSTRMDVRALGNKAESGPSDRVDAVLVER